MSLLTTGSQSGLGRFLVDRFGGHEWNRDTPNGTIRQVERDGADTILHCAFNAAKSVTSSSLFQYLSDNVLLTERLTRIPHRKFIYFSSVDVYPPTDGLATEETQIDLTKVRSIYGIAKLMSEALVKENCENWLILRCVSLLGQYSRKSSLLRILQDRTCTIGLTADSKLNCVLHQGIADLVSLARQNDLQGVFNVASSTPIDLGHVATLFKRNVGFGTFRYDVGKIANSKLCAIDDRFDKSSEDVIRTFASSLETNTLSTDLSRVTEVKMPS